MALCQLVYISRRTKQLSSDAIHEIVERSKAANTKLDITGVLMCVGPYLMQVLEGELTAVIALLERIRADSRHCDVVNLVCKNVSKRMFGEWGMELADLESTTKIDRARLSLLIEDVRKEHDTGKHSVEVRLLINDFRRQAAA